MALAVVLIQILAAAVIIVLVVQVGIDHWRMKDLERRPNGTTSQDDLAETRRQRNAAQNMLEQAKSVRAQAEKAEKAANGHA